MAMIVRVQEPALLDRVKPGEQIRFHAEKVNRLLTVTEIETAELPQ